MMRPLHIIIVFCALFLPSGILYASDAAWEMRTSGSKAAIGEEVVVDILVGSGDDAINAIAGTISLRGASTSGLRIHDGDSIVHTWVSRAQNRDLRRVTFSGIIPNGVTVEKGKVLTLYITPSDFGVLDVSVLGTVYFERAPGVPFALTKEAVSITIEGVHEKTATSTLEEEIRDRTPPSHIRAVFLKNEDPNAFDGKPFIIVVQAKDDESGVHSFELLESDYYFDVEDIVRDIRLDWRPIADFMAPLNRATESSYIYVRATDREGNAAVALVGHPAELSPENTQKRFNEGTILAILIVSGGLLLGLFWWFKSFI